MRGNIGHGRYTYVEDATGEEFIELESDETGVITRWKLRRIPASQSQSGSTEFVQHSPRRVGERTTTSG